MKLNVFSGARRIAVLVGALIVVGCAAYAAFGNATARVYYRVVALSAPWLTTECVRDDVSEWVSKTTPSGDVSVTICFAQAEAEDGRRLVPFKTIEGTDRILLGDRYSSEVSAYKRKVAEELVLSKEAVEVANKSRWESRVQNWKDAGLFLVCAIAFLWILTACIGWVVRGFMGVPQGKDRRDA